MDINCFTYSPVVGIIPGIKLEVDVQKPEGGFHRPHVLVGNRFFSIDSGSKPVWDKDRLLAAQVESVTDGEKSYQVLTRRTQNTSAVLMIDLKSVPKGVKFKLNPSAVNAWVHIETDGDMLFFDKIDGKCLIEFSKELESATIFVADGSVHRVVCNEGTIMTQSLTIAEQAKERVGLTNFIVSQYRKDIADESSNVTIRRLHGILGGINRLLQMVVNRDRSAADILINFLADFVGEEMPVSMRRDINSLLRAYQHPLAATFAEPEVFDNVVNLNLLRDKFRTAEKKGPPAEEKKRKQDRAARDRAAHLEKLGAPAKSERKRASQKK